jgi:hypothetical protein
VPGFALVSAEPAEEDGYMECNYSNLVSHVSKEMFSDDDDQSQMLADIYLSASQAEKDVLDRAFICLCGWSLKTLMDRCEKRGVQDTTRPDWWGEN